MTEFVSEQQPFRIARSTRLLPCWAVLLALLWSCGSLPSWEPVATQDLHLLVEYDLSPSRTAPVRLPVSTPDLKVIDLDLQPAPRSQFFAPEEDARLVHPPTGTKRFKVRCHLRLYQQLDADGEPRRFPTPSELFRGASRITRF